nr:hypothetical protein [Pyrinomonadaceae bacterium]
MPTKNGKFQDYDSVSPVSNKNGGNGHISTLSRNGHISSLKKSEKINAPLFADEPLTLTPKGFIEKQKDNFTEQPVQQIELKQANEIETNEKENKIAKSIEEIKNPLSYAEQQKLNKKQKAKDKDQKLLDSDGWLAKNGHGLTFIGIYVFTIFVLFRPYEIIPALSFLSTSAFYIAVATLLIYLPTQFTTEGNLTTLSTEVKCILFITIYSLLTMPIAKSPPLAWETFNDSFSKAVAVFIVMVNVLRTEQRLKQLIWVSLAVAAWLSYTAINLFMSGEATVEGYRVDANVKGLFGNPNDLSLHLVTMIPITLALALGAKSKIIKII